MKKFFQDFKDFALKGNVIDLAIAVIIGGAFGKVVSSVVNDIILPPIGLLLGKVDFRFLELVIQNEPHISLKYGSFIQTIIDFTIIAFCIFVVLKAYYKILPKKVELPKGPSNEEKLLEEIRDILKNK
ncbi:MAG: large-conductance mechanosensitive channel protein MscL [Ignavibacteria bacterium]|nr:large-conductance mechanosensitive channel protein MscL [Ignavibacteria bacterium]